MCHCRACLQHARAEREKQCVCLFSMSLARVVLNSIREAAGRSNDNDDHNEKCDKRETSRLQYANECLVWKSFIGWRLEMEEQSVWIYGNGIVFGLNWIWDSSVYGKVMKSENQSVELNKRTHIHAHAHTPRQPHNTHLQCVPVLCTDVTPAPNDFGISIFAPNAGFYSKWMISCSFQLTILWQRRPATSMRMYNWDRYKEKTENLCNFLSFFFGFLFSYYLDRLAMDAIAWDKLNAVTLEWLLPPFYRIAFEFCGLFSGLHGNYIVVWIASWQIRCTQWDRVKLKL